MLPLNARPPSPGLDVPARLQRLARKCRRGALARLAPRIPSFPGRAQRGKYPRMVEFARMQPVTNLACQARMTELVVQAERRGELPPTRFTPDLLKRQQPPLSELRAAFGLHQLSRAIAACLCSLDLTYPDDRPGRDLGPPEDPARMPEWTARVSYAVVRLLILGAALAGAYKEPLFKALQHQDPEIQALPRRVPREPSHITWEWARDNKLGRKEMAFLLQFAVCDLDASPEAQDAVFSPIADWLLESILSDKEARQAMADRFEQRYGRATFCIQREEWEEGDQCPVGLLTDGRGTHSDAHLVVWELMKMLWLIQQVYPIVDSYSGDGVLDRRMPRPLSTTQRVDADEHSQCPLKSAVAVFFGMFKAEETLLTARPLKGPPKNLITYPAVPETKEGGYGDGKLPRTISVSVFFDYIFNNSGQPNHIDGPGVLVPPLELKFFEYFLQRHLGLCINDAAFTDDPGADIEELSYETFVGTATIFSYDDVGNRRAMCGGTLQVGDFLDGSEMLMKIPQDSTRIYLQREP